MCGVCKKEESQKRDVKSECGQVSFLFLLPFPFPTFPSSLALLWHLPQFILFLSQTLPRPLFLQNKRPQSVKKSTGHQNKDHQNERDRDGLDDLCDSALSPSPQQEAINVSSDSEEEEEERRRRERRNK
eukprot:TRINITY_DN6639_c0_g3_i2.p1 TRINITY_DN6639_c0_g3~~TRINITY_DN6639_c0_g3_i2.p1  ORF type:complete len:129 (-),score=34.73 TRINITY_DN6639_c0_g3_i2:74-460(-)